MKYRKQLTHELTNIANLRSALPEAFTWSQTPQGFDYWFGVYAELVVLTEQIEEQLKIIDED